MIKGLEALKRIKNTPTYDNGLVKDFHPSCCEIIEKELKALEIIRTKKVNVNCIISGWSLGKYNSYKTHINLTQEEYELLKEVLL